MEDTDDLTRLSEVTLGGRAPLPRPRLKGEMSVEEAVERRRSVRDFSAAPLGLGEISQLLWAAQGLTGREGLRAAPSAGARYPLETYCVCAHGLFHYQPPDHVVVRLQAEDIRIPLASACWGQTFIAEAPVSIVFAAVYERTTSRYGDRGLRYVHMDIGHAAENVHLQAEALGLGSVPVGAFGDAAVEGVLQLPADHKPLYIVSVGRRAHA